MVRAEVLAIASMMLLWTNFINMLPTINVFGHVISMYGLLCLSGIIIAILLSLLRAKKNCMNKDDVLYIGILSALGIVAGGKIMYLLLNIPFIVKYASVIFASFDQLVAYMSGGYVFYGGLFGAILVIYFYCKKFKVPFEQAMICMVPSFPVAHAIGRIGCLMAGCCYGINGLPVQLFESIGNMIIFVILLIIEKCGNREKVPLSYLSMYAVMRFVLEFFRADPERGFFLFFSTSQWISCLIIIYVIYRVIKSKKQQNA